VIYLPADCCLIELTL